MKHDKHKAKNSARYKRKQNAKNKGKESAENRTGKSTSTNTTTASRDDKAKAGLVATTEVILEQQHEVQVDLQKSISRRKTESPWSSYVDFNVDQTEEEERPERRGKDFQTLLSQSGSADSQLRLKGETWDDNANQDESEVSELFKVDFAEVADRLLAIPLHERLGISSKYFEEDLLDKINEDAAEHRKRIQCMIDEERTKKNISHNSSDNHRTQEMVGSSKSVVQDNEKSDVKIEESNEQRQEKPGDGHVHVASNETRTDEEVQCSDYVKLENVQPSTPDGCAKSVVSDHPLSRDVYPEKNTSEFERNASKVAREAAAPQKEENDSSKKTDHPASSQTEEVEELEDWLSDCLDH